MKDYFYKKAKSEDYKARSVYKLQEINEKFRIFKTSDRVLDLGSAPGSWVQYISNMIKNKGLVIGVDLKAVQGDFPENCIFLTKSIYELNEGDFHKLVKKFDVITSDMAPSTTGVKDIDQEASLDLCRAAFKVCATMLELNGHFVFKIFQSNQVKSFVDELKKVFKNVQIIKPKSTRKISSEIFVVAMNYSNTISLLKD